MNSCFMSVYQRLKSAKPPRTHNNPPPPSPLPDLSFDPARLYYVFSPIFGSDLIFLKITLSSFYLLCQIDISDNKSISLYQYNLSQNRILRHVVSAVCMQRDRFQIIDRQCIYCNKQLSRTLFVHYPVLYPTDPAWFLLFFSIKHKEENKLPKITAAFYTSIA